jgi:methanol metabolism-related c-type cytochrome
LKITILAGALGTIALIGLANAAIAAEDGAGDPTATTEVDGKFFDADGDPTFKIGSDGSTDWYTFSGFRRYHSECHVCHGPAGEGSTYAPALVQSLKTMPYAAFQDVVVNGRKNIAAGKESMMPSLGTNRNVMCYLDDIYIYLRARTNGAVDRARPAKHADKPPGYTEAENSCMGP